MKRMLFNLKVRILLKYFRREAKRKVKPDLFQNHMYVISYRTVSGNELYFDGNDFTSNNFRAKEYTDIETLKSGLNKARLLYASCRISRLNSYNKEERKFKNEYKLIKNL
jgi:hypothetical protein